MKKYLFFVVLTMISYSIKAQVVINEYSCSNINTYLDDYNNYEDWVELYNSGAANINLTGYYLSDDPTDLQKFQIPTVTDILPNGRKMVFASNKNTISPTGQIHTNFRLTQSHGNWIILSNPSGIVVDSLKCQLTLIGHSRGRVTDGAATFGVFTTPTPNVNNATATAYTKYATKPSFNINAGNYTSTQNITITSPDPNVTIYYTLDGTLPTTTSTPFTVPIVVSSTKAIRTRAISSVSSILPSFCETNTYFINDAVDSRYNVVSMCGPFTPTTAIGGNYLFSWMATPAWASLEYFDNNFNQQFEQDILASKHGNDSWAYNQKGMDIEAYDETGTKAEFAGAFWATTLKDTFARFILKAGASDNFPLGPGNSCHLRDVFTQTLAEKYNLDMDYRRFRPSIVFINGQYWGVYDMRERVDNEYFKYNYNVPSKKVDHLSYWGGLTIRNGSDTGWNNLYAYIMNPLNPMSVQSNYNHVKDFLNVKSFIQYFILNEYLVNHDWLNWNTMWWRGYSNSNPVKWRYALWDEDAVCGLQNPNYTGVGTTGPTNNPCEPTTLFQGNLSIKHTDMLTKLFNSPEFTQQFQNEWIDMFNGPFKCENILAHFDSVVNVFSPEMNRQSIRWGGSVATWNTNVAAMRTWITSRCAYIGAALDTCLGVNPQEIKLNVSPTNAGTIAMDGNVKSPYVWSRVIQGDSIYQLKATPTAGPYWTFDHWQYQDLTNTFNPNTTTDSVSFNFKKKDSVIAFFKYFNYDSVNMSFNVLPVNTGTITLNGFLIPAYPASFILDKRFSYTINATPSSGFLFSTWQNNDAQTIISPNLTTSSATFTYKIADTITAIFDTIPPPPPIPPIDNSIFIPSAFSPNGDTKNDLFSIYFSPDVLNVDIKVFNRFGTNVYHSTKITGGWNGKYMNVDCEIGTYNYLVQVVYKDNSKKLYKGDVTLIR